MSFLSSLLNALPGAVAQGLIWGLMAIGVYITFRILDVADLTVDGSLATGGAVAVMLIRADKALYHAKHNARSRAVVLKANDQYLILDEENHKVV